MIPLIRKNLDGSGLYDVEYVTIWQWLISRVCNKPEYVKNVERAEKEGLTYLPRLYKKEDLPRPIL